MAETRLHLGGRIGPSEMLLVGEWSDRSATMRCFKLQCSGDLFLGFVGYIFLFIGMTRQAYSCTHACTLTDVEH